VVARRRAGDTMPLPEQGIQPIGDKRVETDLSVALKGKRRNVNLTWWTGNRMV